MKRFFTLFLACLSILCLFLVGCSDDGVPDGMKTASSPELVDYYLYVPEAWVLDNTAPSKITGAHASSSDRTSVNVQRLNYTSFDSFFADYKANATVKFQNVVYGDEVSDYVIAGLNGNKFTYTCDFADGMKLKYEVYTVVNFEKIYVITFVFYGVESNGQITYTDTNHTDNVKSIVDNFKFKDAPTVTEPVFTVDGTPENMKCASDTEIVDYKLFVPSTWTVETAASGTVSAASRYFAGSGINLNIMQWNVASYDFDAWWADYENQLHNFMSDVKVTTYGKDENGGDIKHKDITVDGNEAREYLFSAKIDGKAYNYRVIGIMHRASVYVVTFTIEGDSVFSSFSNDMDKIITSFKFI
jgi:hypothetical protein